MRKCFLLISFLTLTKLAYSYVHIEKNDLPSPSKLTILDKKGTISDTKLNQTAWDPRWIELNSSYHNISSFLEIDNNQLCETLYDKDGKLLKSKRCLNSYLGLMKFYGISVENTPVRDPRVFNSMDHVIGITNFGITIYPSTDSLTGYSLIRYPEGVTHDDVISVHSSVVDKGIDPNHSGIDLYEVDLLLNVRNKGVYIYQYSLQSENPGISTKPVAHIFIPKQYGDVKIKDAYVDFNSNFYFSTNEGTFTAQDKYAKNQQDLNYEVSLINWKHNNSAFSSDLGQISLLRKQDGWFDRDPGNICVLSENNQSIYCLKNEKWHQTSIPFGYTPTPGSLYQYYMSGDNNTTNTISVSLIPNGESLSNMPYVIVSYLGNTGRLISRSNPKELSPKTPLKIDVVDIFKNYSGNALEDPYWYKMNVGQVELSFYNGASKEEFATMRYDVILDKSSIYQANQLGAVHLDQKDFGVRQGWKIDTHLQYTNDQDIQFISLTAPSNKIAFSKNAAPVGRDFNLDIHFDGSQSGQVPKLYNNGRQQIPLYVTVCPKEQQDPPITDDQLAEIKQYVTINNQNTISQIGYHTDLHGGSYTEIQNDYLPGIFNASSIYKGYESGSLASGNCANMPGAKTFVLYVSAKTATNSLPVYASVKYVDAYGKVQTATTQQSTQNTIQVVTPNYHYQDADFAPTECKYIDDADALHAKYTCQATVKTAGKLPGIDHMAYNKIYQLDNQNNQVVRLLEPDVDIASDNLLTMSFYKPYYPTDHVGTNLYIDAKGVDQYGNEVSVSMKPSLNQKDAPKTYGLVEASFPSNVIYQSAGPGALKQAYPDHFIELDYTHELQTYSSDHATTCPAGMCFSGNETLNSAFSGPFGGLSLAYKFYLFYEQSGIAGGAYDYGLDSSSITSGESNYTVGTLTDCHKGDYLPDKPGFTYVNDKKHKNME